ncbi:hypothetical protein Gotri_005405 [Gossypium trilobum]|uniref:Uncharacterized protein n=1 Tax=Gossypium trilobum TaxID=34281 RepID=A0A7J9EY54_9ROSI|nr:hypothetical protein [Gossypium trilobum]
MLSYRRGWGLMLPNLYNAIYSKEEDWSEFSNIISESLPPDQPPQNPAPREAMSEDAPPFQTQDHDSLTIPLLSHQQRSINSTSQVAIVGANVCPIESLDYE